MHTGVETKSRKDVYQQHAARLVLSTIVTSSKILQPVAISLSRSLKGTHTVGYEANKPTITIDSSRQANIGTSFSAKF